VSAKDMVIMISKGATIISQRLAATHFSSVKRKGREYTVFVICVNPL